jgi:N-acetylgalactosamine-6-sulfatase
MPRCVPTRRGRWRGRLVLWFLGSLLGGLGLPAQLPGQQPAAGLAAAAPKPPNILVILCDDMGWRDLSCFGNDRVATPNVDRLAAEGTKLTQFYAACPVCTPTRISILTGKYPLRFDVRLAFRDLGEFLPLCTTLPKLLRQAGYRTAHLGKWHLGGVRLKDCTQRDRVPGPHEHGFDHYLTQIEEQPLRGDMIKQKILFRKGGTCLLRDDRKVGPDDAYYTMHFTDILGDEAIRLIRASCADGSRPFFVNLWFMDPHQPYEPAPEPHWSRTAADGISDDQHRFRSMVARMDYQVGRILAELDTLEMAENTLVLFSSDNGGAYEANIGPLKGGKTDLHEGGIRVPFVARWPGRIRAGVESAELGESTDILPTCCAAAGVSLPGGDRFDGRDLLPLLMRRVETLGLRTLFWQIDLTRTMQRHEPKPRPYATEAARRGRWKLLTFDGKPVELFDIEADPGEQTNRLADEPEIAEALRKEIADRLAEPRRRFGTID